MSTATPASLRIEDVILLRSGVPPSESYLGRRRTVGTYYVCRDLESEEERWEAWLSIGDVDQLIVSGATPEEAAKKLDDRMRAGAEGLLAQLQRGAR